MKLKNTVILLVLALAGFAYIYFVDQHRSSTKEIAEEGNRVVKFERDKITAISIKNTEVKMELKKDDKGQWQIVEPLKDRADFQAIQQLFTEAEALKYVDKIDNGGKGASKDQLKDFGLSDPATKVRFTGDEKPVELLFGKDTASEGKGYAKLENTNAVYVIANALRTQLSKKADDFRDKNLTNIATTQVTKATLKTAAGEIEFQKNKDGHWSLTKPLKARGDDSKIRDLIAQAANARAESFVADAANLSAYGLQEPRGTLALVTEGSEQPAVLQIGTNPKDSTEKTYARLSTRDAVVVVPKAIESLLDVKPNDLRDKSLVRVEADIVDRINIEGAGREKIVIARSGESWVRKAGDKEVPINAAAATRLLADLRAAKVAGFIADVASDLAKYGLDQPLVKLTLSSYASENTAETKAGEKPIVTVLFGKAENAIVYAKLDDEPFIVAVQPELLEAALTDPNQWQPLEIYRHKTEDITAVEVTRDGQPTISLVRDKDKGWKLAKGDGSVNQVNASSLVNTLAALRAVRWVGATKPEHGFGKPALSVAFKTAGGTSGRLTVGNVTAEEMWHANAEGFTGTFEIAQPDKGALELPLLDKPAAPAPAAGGAAATAPPVPVPSAPEAPKPTEASTPPKP